MTWVLAPPWAGCWALLDSSLAVTALLALVLVLGVVVVSWESFAISVSAWTVREGAFWGGLFVSAVVGRLEAPEGAAEVRAGARAANFLGVARLFFPLLDCVLTALAFFLAGAMLGVRDVLGEVWDFWDLGAGRFLPLRALYIPLSESMSSSPSLSAESLPPSKSSSSEEFAERSPVT